MSYTDINSRTIDQWVEDGWEWGKPIDHETYEKAKQGEWQIILTPTRPVPKEWYPELKGCKVLGLACGGAQQMPILTAAGADCTVLDYSEKQLQSERGVSVFSASYSLRARSLIKNVWKVPTFSSPL